jgi:hypothetical protein
MNKIELKELWGKYYDTDQNVTDAIALLKKAKQQQSVHGVCTLLAESHLNKTNLLAIMMKSKHYIGNGRIAIPAEFERKIDSREISEFFNNIKEKLCLDHMFKYEDEHGKTIHDYLTAGKRVVNISALPNGKKQDVQIKAMGCFDWATSATKESANKYYGFLEYANEFRYIPFVNLPNDVYKPDRSDLPHLKKGTKTSRAFNEVCCFYGIDKLNPQTVTKEENGQTVTRIVYPYNKAFAKYSDLVSNLTRKMYYIISVNPLDYLMMSNGVSWHSCHDIMGGGYRGGTLSYMLDGTSMVTYVVSDLDMPLHEAPRYYRQMFHYDNGLFLQNRLYPQGNDGATDLYTKFRNMVITEFTDLLGTNNEWEMEVGYQVCCDHTESYGVHYKDYRHNRQCNVFYPKSKKMTVKDHVMTIGHTGICTKCGRQYSNSSRLSHSKGDWECVVE